MQQPCQLLTWVNEDLLSRRDVDKLLFRLFLLRLRLEVVGMPLLRQLPVRLDDLLLVCTPEKEEEKKNNVGESHLERSAR